MINFLWENILKKTDKVHTVSRAIAENILFKDLSVSERRFVEQIIHERQYRKGEFVFRQGEAGVGMYIIVKGAVDIFVGEVAVGGSGGHKVTHLIEGDFFGELSLVEDAGRRSASAIASEDSILIGFFKPDLLELLERSPSIGVKVVFRLAEVLGRRLRETTDKISHLKKELEDSTDKGRSN